jgi:hypothetical protein
VAERTAQPRAGQKIQSGTLPMEQNRSCRTSYASHDSGTAAQNPFSHRGKAGRGWGGGAIISTDGQLQRRMQSMIHGLWNMPRQLAEFVRLT